MQKWSVLFQQQRNWAETKGQTNLSVDNKSYQLMCVIRLFLPRHWRHRGQLVAKRGGLSRRCVCARGASRVAYWISFTVFPDTGSHTPADSPAVRPSPSRSSSRPARRTPRTGSWWRTPRAWARGRWLCSTWRRCCVSPTRGESRRRGHGVCSRCCWLVQKLWGEGGRGKRGEVRK